MNEHAGHKVPTGDPERFILIDFKLIDSQRNSFSKDRTNWGNMGMVSKGT
jgi:hypothetical protein